MEKPGWEASPGPSPSASIILTTGVPGSRALLLLIERGRLGRLAGVAARVVNHDDRFVLVRINADRSSLDNFGMGGAVRLNRGL